MYDDSHLRADSPRDGSSDDEEGDHPPGAPLAIEDAPRLPVTVPTRLHGVRPGEALEGEAVCFKRARQDLDPEARLGVPHSRDCEICRSAVAATRCLCGTFACFGCWSTADIRCLECLEAGKLTAKRHRSMPP